MTDRDSSRSGEQINDPPNSDQMMVVAFVARVSNDGMIAKIHASYRLKGTKEGSTMIFPSHLARFTDERW